jgi:hypothetical protein
LQASVTATDGWMPGLGRDYLPLLRSAISLQSDFFMDYHNFSCILPMNHKTVILLAIT